MNATPFPAPTLKTFSSIANAIQRSSWYNADWSCCPGLWKTDRYPETVARAYGDDEPEYSLADHGDNPNLPGAINSERFPS